VFLAQFQLRSYHPKWLPKYAAVYKSTYFDDVNRRWDYLKLNHDKYRTQDPLFFDHDLSYVNGGIELMIA
jgi:hypothetical protein